MYGGAIQCGSIDDLRSSIFSAVNRINQGYLKSLVRFMPNRGMDVLEKRGGHTSY